MRLLVYHVHCKIDQDNSSTKSCSIHASIYLYMHKSDNYTLWYRYNMYVPTARGRSWSGHGRAGGAERSRATCTVLVRPGQGTKAYPGHWWADKARWRAHAIQGASRARASGQGGAVRWARRTASATWREEGGLDARWMVNPNVRYTVLDTCRR